MQLSVIRYSKNQESKKEEWIDWPLYHYIRPRSRYHARFIS